MKPDRASIQVNALRLPPWALIVGFCCAACGSDPARLPVDPDPPPADTARFEDVSATHLPSGTLSGRDMDVEAVDVDADGDLDLVVAVEFGANLLLINDGSGRYARSAGLSTPVHDSEDIAVADFDQDGDPDLVFVAEDDRTNEYYLNDGSGAFTPAPGGLGTEGVSNAVVAADLNGDGAPDLLVGNAGTNVFLLGDGRGGFTDETAARYPAVNRTTQDLELGDIDGDGDLDLIEANEDGNRILVNEGDGFFRPEPDRFPSRPSEETREADLGDIDGDGDLDLVLGNVAFRPGKDAVNRVLINDGAGFFTDESSARLSEGVVSTVDVDLFDLDGDGDLDLLEANFGGTGYRILLNDGTGVFADSTPGFLPTSVRGAGVDLEVFDANADGQPDLFLTHYQGPDFLLVGRP